MPNKQQKRERDRQDVVLFFELIQIAIGNRAHLSFPPNNIQWNNTFTIAVSYTHLTLPTTSRV